MSAKALVIRELAKHYWRARRDFQWMEDEEPQVATLSLVERIEDPAPTNEREVAMTSWRKQHGKASVPLEVREQIRRQFTEF